MSNHGGAKYMLLVNWCAMHMSSECIELHIFFDSTSTRRNFNITLLMAYGSISFPSLVILDARSGGWVSDS